MTKPNWEAIIADYQNLVAEIEQLKKDKRDFAIQVGYEIGGWIDANDPLPDIEAIVNEMLASGISPGQPHPLAPEGCWQPIETIPQAKFVMMYSPLYHATAGCNKKGVMQGYCHHATPTCPVAFYDDFSIPVHWDFTHWMEIPGAPQC